MDEATDWLTPLYQCLNVEVDLEKSTLRGATKFWLRQLPISHGRGDTTYPSEIALHCRQCNITSTKVNGSRSLTTHLDPLEEVVPATLDYRDAETFDLCYRAKLCAAARNQSGELRIQVPSKYDRAPALPPELPDTAPPAARARWHDTVRLIQQARDMEARNEEKRKLGLGQTGPPRSPSVPFSPNTMASPSAQSPGAGMDVTDSPNLRGEGRGQQGGPGGAGLGLGLEDDDYYFDEEDTGEVKPAVEEAHRKMKQDANARMLCVEVEWTLMNSRSGVVFRTVKDGFSAPHMYTTYSHAPVDMDGPRCWFPCIDHVSMLITYDVTLAVKSSKITAAFNGKLVDTTATIDDDGEKTGVSYRFVTEALTAARAVGMVVGKFGAWDVAQSPRVKGMFLRGGGATNGARSGVEGNRRAIEESLSAATGGLLAHVSAAISFLEEWLKADYPFGRCTQVFVEGLPDIFYPFGSLCLVRAELLCTPDDRIPDGDVPGDARLSVIEVLLYGWVTSALRLKGGQHRWLVHGMSGHLLSVFGAELRGEEEKQHRLWRAVQRAISLDCELGCPSISPPNPDSYLPDAIDPATAAYTRLKAALILHMIAVKVQPADLQEALGQMMLPIADHVKGADLGLSGQLSAFALTRQSSTLSQAAQTTMSRQQSFSSMASAERGGARAAGAAGEPSLGEEIGSHFMQPLTGLDFMQLVRNVAARGGHDLGKDLTESFYSQWVSGQCLPYLRVGYLYKKKANVVNLVVEQVVPPWLGGIACHGPMTVEVYEADSAGGGTSRRHVEQLPASRDEKKTPTHVETIALTVQAKSRRRRRPALGNPRPVSGVPRLEGAASGVSLGPQPPASSSTAGDTGAGGGAAAGGGGPAASVPTSGPGSTERDDDAGTSSTANVGFGFGVGGEAGEVDPERQAAFQAHDANPSPVLWVKVNPDLEWIMNVRMRKPWHQWVEQLFSDESVEAQCDALRGLVELPLSFEAKSSEVPVQAIAEAVRGRVAHTQMEHAPCVRQEAAVALALWQNQHAPLHAGGFGESKQARAKNWRGLYHLLEAFGERFEQRQPIMASGGNVANSKNSALLLPNWFDDAAEYRLKKSLIWAASNMRARDGCTPRESLDLLVTLLRENDNCENPYADDYYVAQVLTALGQVSTTLEAELPVSSINDAIAQARIWLDLDMLGVPAGRSARKSDPRTKSHNGVVSACAIQCLCQLELLRGGMPEVEYEAFTSRRHPTAVRIAAIQSMIQLFLAYDNGIHDGDPAEGLSCALIWVLDFVESEHFAGDTRPRYWAVRCILDALERRPLVASHLARYQTDDPLLGECDPWAGNEFFTPRGPGRAAYRPNGPLPKNFPAVTDVAERLWSLMMRRTAYDQGLRHLCFQLWRDLWGLETPPCLKAKVKEKTPGWRERLVVGEARHSSKGYAAKMTAEKRRRVEPVIDRMAFKVTGWVVGRYRRREWIDRDWIAWYYRDRERQARAEENGFGKQDKRNGEDEEDDITTIPSDGSYGPDPLKDSHADGDENMPAQANHRQEGGDDTQREEGAVGGVGAASGGSGSGLQGGRDGALRKIVVRAPVSRVGGL